MLEIEPESHACKANTLPATLSLKPLGSSIFWGLILGHTQQFLGAIPSSALQELLLTVLKGSYGILWIKPGSDFQLKGVAGCQVEARSDSLAAGLVATGQLCNVV